MAQEKIKPTIQEILKLGLFEKYYCHPSLLKIFTPSLLEEGRNKVELNKWDGLNKSFVQRLVLRHNIIYIKFICMF
jgi:hypothetical protein